MLVGLPLFTFPAPKLELCRCRRRRAWWRAKDKPRPTPDAKTVAYLRRGSAGEGYWAQVTLRPPR